MKSTLKDPCSLAFGFEIRTSRIRFCGSMEYFFRVEEYTMIKDNSQTVIRPVRNNSPSYITDYLTIREAKSAVINGGIGFEYRFKTKNEGEDKEHTFSILAGIRADFNNE